jgi:hypothetical protein
MQAQIKALLNENQELKLQAEGEGAAFVGIFMHRPPPERQFWISQMVFRSSHHHLFAICPFLPLRLRQHVGQKGRQHDTGFFGQAARYAQDARRARGRPQNSR